MKTLRFFILSLALLSSVVVAARADAPAPTKDQARFEVSFLTNMIDHHYGAVKMAELCTGRTIHPELQQMCDSIKTSQTKEIATMQGWLQQWYGVTHAPELDRKMQKMIDQLSKLTGAEFEQEFMMMMIDHHAVAVRRGLDCLLNAYHAEMLNMCAMMLGAQGDEIAQMRIWLCQWYSMCDLDEKHHH